jgi:hypothetical protein
VRAVALRCVGCVSERVRLGLVVVVVVVVEGRGKKGGLLMMTDVHCCPCRCRRSHCSHDVSESNQINSCPHIN